MRGVKDYKIKGGKISNDTASIVVLQEILNHKAFVQEVKDLGVISSNDAAKHYRDILVRYSNKEAKQRLSKIFAELNLSV